jgi:hypothetical protein
MRLFFMLAVALTLAACSGPRFPFEKDAPAKGAPTQLVNPPWETLVRAGPGADKDLDLETLNGPLTQPAPPPVAAVDAPPSLAEEEVAEKKSQPISKPEKQGVVIKAVAVPSVMGADGKGNQELTEAMRQVLRDAGWAVVKAPAANALTIRGKVKLGTAQGQTQNVKLDWSVTSPDGKVLGSISQANDVEAGSLQAGWGENARYATEAAAEGIFKLIQKYK